MYKDKNQASQTNGTGNIASPKCFFLLLSRRCFSRLEISVVLYLQGFQQAVAKLRNPLDSSNAHLCCLLHSEYLGTGAGKQAYHL